MTREFFNQRLRNLEAINRSTIHQSLATASSHVAMARCKGATVSDPMQAVNLVRAIVQSEINEKIRAVIQEYVDTYFQPAVENVKNNLGEENVSARLLDDVCMSVLEHAKDMYTKQEKPNKKKVLKRKSSQQDFAIKKKASPRPNTDLILVAKTGKPVRREGPKWETNRFTTDTLFILGSKANKALGFGQTRGRLYIKHPDLFKYSGDQEDKEWLAKNQYMSTTGGKAYLMVLSDILELMESSDYASNARSQPAELMGFRVPDFMIEKMRSFADQVRTDPTVSDEELLRSAQRLMAAGSAADETPPPVAVPFVPTPPPADTPAAAEQQVQQILNEMKEAEDDDLGFLQGMNLNTLVREFEMDTGNGTQHLTTILSLADDHEFPELGESVEIANSSGHNIESLGDIDFE